MGKRNIESMKKLLLKMKEEIINEISDSVSEEDVKMEKEGDVGDIHDTFVASREKEFKLLMTDRERKKLAQIEEAIKKIEEGTYGECEVCGEKIPFKRLRIMPFTKLCVECQEKSEKNEQHMQQIESQRFLKNISLDEFNVDE